MEAQAAAVAERSEMARAIASMSQVLRKLGDAFVGDREKDGQPWRAVHQAALRQQALFVEVDEETLQRQTLAHATARLLTPEDVMPLTYVIFGTATSSRFYANVKIGRR